MWTKVQKSKTSPPPHAGPSLEGHACGGRPPCRRSSASVSASPWGSLPSATQGVFAVVNGTAQFLQHDFQRGVLRKLDHEHACLHADVARVWGTYGKMGSVLEGWAGIPGRPRPGWPSHGTGGGAEDSGGEKADTPLLT